jgi:hypothetical protein
MAHELPCPIPGYRFATFGSWYGFECAIDEKISLFYKAPLDTVPRPVFVTKRFKNRKVRITSGEVTFTADSAHLERFYWLEKELNHDGNGIEEGEVDTEATESD